VQSVAPYGVVVEDTTASSAVTHTIRVRDPRYGWRAPVDSVRSVLLPSGRNRSETSTRTVEGGGRYVNESFRVNGRMWLTRYDTLARVLTTRSPSGRTSTLELDAAGRPVLVTVPGQLPTAFAYDTRGKLERVAQGERGWRYGYDAQGRVREVRDTLGRMTTFDAYDAADRVVQQTLPGGRVVGYGYDANGNLDSLAVPGGAVHRFGHTPVDLTGTYTPPVVAGVPNPATSYAYDRDRQLEQVTRPDGAVVDPAYHATTGQLVSLTQPRGTTTLAYVTSPATGQLASVTSPDTVTCTYGYDGPFVVSETWSGAVAGTVSRTRTPSFLDSTETVSVGGTASTVVFERDADDLLTQLRHPGSAWTFALTRNAASGVLEGTSVGSGAGQVTSSHVRNAYGELSELHYQRGGAPLFSQWLTRNAIGQVTRIEESWSGGARVRRDYGYDAAGRLDSLAVDGAPERRWEYDAGAPGNGNRTAEYGPVSSDTQCCAVRRHPVLRTLPPVNGAPDCDFRSHLPRRRAWPDSVDG
jgi:YD repeat-containing protein